jgi:GNAT superfamily N-acetyltransferase
MYRIKRGTARRPALKPKYENAAYEFVKGIMFNRPQFTSFLKTRHRNYILKNRGTLKGFAILAKPRTNGSWVLDLIGTSAEPGKGYGKALMNRITANAARKGAGLVFIHDPVGPARGFYKKLGATSVTKQLSNMTSLMRLPTGAKRQRSPSPTSRRQATPNRQRSPSRPSPKRPSFSPRSSAQQSANGRTPRM